MSKVIVKKMTARQVKYLTNKQAVDYFLHGGEPFGNWEGRGAEEQGLTGKVEDGPFENIFRGLSPDGQRQWRQPQNYAKVHLGCGKVRQSQVGWEFLFTVDKSISARWAYAPEQERRQIQQAVATATKAALTAIEENAAWTRRGQGGTRRERVKLIIADFEHCTARPTSKDPDLPPDPHLHHHSVIMNCGIRADGSFGSLDSRPLYEYQATATAIFDATLAHELERGFRCEHDATGVRIADVPQALCTHWSKRHQIIAEHPNGAGQHTAAQGHAIAQATRRAKGHVPPRKDLLEFWRAEAMQFGVTPDLNGPTSAKSDPQVKPDIQQPPHEAGEQPAARQDRPTQGDAVRHEQASGQSGPRAEPTRPGQSADDARSGPNTDANANAENERAKSGPKTGRAKSRPATEGTTGAGDEPKRAARQTVTELEADLAERIGRLSVDLSFIVRKPIVREAVERFRQPRHYLAAEITFHAQQLRRAFRRKPTTRIDREALSQQTRQTLNHAGRSILRDLTQRPGRVVVISQTDSQQRDAAIQAAMWAYQKAGKRVIATSRFRRTRDRLNRAAAIPTMTQRKLEFLMHPTIGYELRHHVRQLARAATNRPTYRLKDYRIDSSTVLIVDLAECMDMPALSRLVKDVERQGGKLILLAPPIDDSRRAKFNRTLWFLHQVSQIGQIDPFKNLAEEMARQQRQHQRPDMGMQP